MSAGLSSPNPHFLSNQTAFRGLMAMWVFFGHLLLNLLYHHIYDAGFADIAHVKWLEPVLAFHFLAVEGFFALSGCLLTLHYWDHFTQSTTGRQIDRFYLLRLARLLPMHYLAMALIGYYAYVGIPHPIYSGREGLLMEYWPLTGLLNLTLMQAWGIVPTASWNEPAWTVSVMFFLYVLFPNLVLAIRHIPHKPRAYLIAAFGLIAAFFLLRTFVALGGRSDGAGGLARGLTFFLVGCLMARLHLTGWKAEWHWGRIGGALALLFIAMTYFWVHVYPFDLTFFHLLYPLLMLCLLRGGGGFAGVLGAKPLQFLGRISYSLFILHYPLLLGIKFLAGESLAALAGQGVTGLISAYALTISIVISLSYLGWRYIEEPSGKYLKAKLKGKA